jgi:hypothetical protein
MATIDSAAASGRRNNGSGTPENLNFPSSAAFDIKRKESAHDGTASGANDRFMTLSIGPQYPGSKDFFDSYFETIHSAAFGHNLLCAISLMHNATCPPGFVSIYVFLLP